MIRGKLLEFQRRDLKRVQQPTDSAAASMGLRWLLVCVVLFAAVGWMWFGGGR